MGLDMYLNVSRYVRYDEKARAFVTDMNGVDTDLTAAMPGKIKRIISEAAYWRKANQIHAWFVKNVQDDEDDCGEYEVTTDQLRALVEACKAVLADHSKAAELLPPQSGFFFGGTDLDEYYFKNLEDTVTMVGAAIEASVEGNRLDFTYGSSW